MEIVIPLKGAVIRGPAAVGQPPKKEQLAKVAAARTERFSRDILENMLSMTAFIGDFAIVVCGFVLSFWIWFLSGFGPQMVEGSAIPSLRSFALQTLFVSAIVVSGFLRKDLYKYKSLLHPRAIVKKFAGSLIVCLVAFTGLSLAMSATPLFSRIFVAFSLLIIFMTICGWRFLLSAAIRHSPLVTRLRKRLVVIGGGSQAERIQQSLKDNTDMQFVGWVQAIKPNQVAALAGSRLGSLYELKEIFNRHEIDIAVLTESESLQREGVLSVARTCENAYVQFKMVPHFFEILISGVSPEVIGGFEVLGSDCLPLTGCQNRTLKRSMDIVGAIVGLALSAPLILICGTLVYLESPGPMFYRQIRLGKNGRLFKMIKIRSMRIDAEAPGKPKWTQENDPRRLRVGAFLRKWNIGGIL